MENSKCFMKQSVRFYLYTYNCYVLIGKEIQQQYLYMFVYNLNRLGLPIQR